VSSHHTADMSEYTFQYSHTGTYYVDMLHTAYTDYLINCTRTNSLDQLSHYYTVCDKPC